CACRQPHLGPGEVRPPLAEGQEGRPRWAGRGAVAAGAIIFAAGTACAAASAGAAQVPARAAAQAAGGTLWVGTSGGASRLRAGGTVAPRWEAFARPRAPLPANQITSIATGPRGEVWLGPRSGLARLTEEEG